MDQLNEFSNPEPEKNKLLNIIESLIMFLSGLGMGDTLWNEGEYRFLITIGLIICSIPVIIKLKK